VTDTGRLRILDAGGAVLADVPAAALHEAAPLYDRPRRRRDRGGEVDPVVLVADAGDAAETLVAMLADTSWVWRQYDHMLFLNTVVGPGGDATVLRLKHPVTGQDTGRALALTTDGNHRWCAVDPRAGTAWVVAEAVLNLACVGARPLAVVNCLNFGNPEHPEVMWELSEAIDGMAEACRELGIPVVGGNVSLYNESDGVDIHPTPVVGVLGIVDELVRRPPGMALPDAGELVLIGPEPAAPSLAGSRWAWERGAKGGVLVALDPVAHLAVAAFVRALVADDLVLAVHDVAEGGLALALAEAAVAGGVGAVVVGLHGVGALFGESPSRALAAVAPAQLDVVRRRAEEAGVALRTIGRTGGDRVVVDGLLDVSVGALARTWRDELPVAFGEASTS
jgi:phosphoribosylformylglycinamidine synthase